jgi:GNAT superfamily N-acetyltransferase
MEWHREEFTISDDRERLNVLWIVASLHTTYWADHRPEEVIRSSLQKSLCFGLYRGDEQIGLARVVTDENTVAWLADVYVDPAYRGRGLGTWLVGTVLDHPAVAPARLKLLGTLDAHGLYRKFGFDAAGERFMARRDS